MAWILSRRQYQTLISNAEVVARGGAQIKVLRLPTGELVKLFRLRRSFSSGWLYPYSVRFARNAARLTEHGVPTVRVIGTHFVPSLWLHCVIYQALPGQVLFDLADDWPSLKLARFIADLHHKGIYFRGLHLGNVVQLPDQRLGLIDVGDSRFKNRPLTPYERVRNLKHLLRRADNRERLGGQTLPQFLQAYLAECETLGDGCRLPEKLEPYKLMSNAQR